MAATEHEIVRSELRWSGVALGAIALLVGLTLYAAMALHRNPPSNLEYVDPSTLHLKGEFTEANLGTRVAEDGSVTARIVTTQYEFQPHCIAVPLNRPVTLRLASPDAVHGILVSQTNVNTMVIPGFVAQVHARFTQPGNLLMPCHEFCGLGHSAMLARVEVLPENKFHPNDQGRVGCGQR